MKIAVLFGGNSEEREVSIASASEVVRALRARGHRVVAVDSAQGRLSSSEDADLAKIAAVGDQPSPSSLETLRVSSNAGEISSAVRGVDVVFIALHGGSGENGQLQALLELAGIPFTGSSSTSSGLAMDKDFSKRLADHGGVRTPKWLLNERDGARVEALLGYPVVVKPNAQGSSVGLYVVDSIDSYASAVEQSAAYGDVITEEYVAGREFTVGILDNVALPVGEIITDTGHVFDYASKYQQGGATEVFPANLSDEIAAELQRAALDIHRLFKLSGYSRSDFRLDQDGRLWFIEANTLPGLTATSLLPQASAAAGISLGELCERICHLALSPTAPGPATPVEGSPT